MTCRRTRWLFRLAEGWEISGNGDFRAWREGNETFFRRFSDLSRFDLKRFHRVLNARFTRSSTFMFDREYTRNPRRIARRGSASEVASIKETTRGWPAYRHGFREHFNRRFIFGKNSFHRPIAATTVRKVPELSDAAPNVPRKFRDTTEKQFVHLFVTQLTLNNRWRI